MCHLERIEARVLLEVPATRSTARHTSSAIEPTGRREEREAGRRSSGSIPSDLRDDLTISKLLHCVDVLIGLEEITVRK